MVRKGMKPLSEDEPTTQVNFKIAPKDLRAVDQAADAIGVSRSKYIRMCVLENNNSPKQGLKILDREIKEDELKLTIKKSIREDRLKEIEANKTAADNRDQAIKKEIEALMPNLESRGNLKDKNIERFIKIKVTTLNNNFKSEGINPLTVEKFTNLLRDHAEAQGVSCL